MTVPRWLRKLVLVASCLVVLLITGLTTAYAATTVYFLVVGGPDRVRQEFSGQIAAERRTSGEKPPFLPIMIFVVGLIAGGFGLGMRLWRVGARRLAGVPEEEIQGVLRM